MDEGKEARFVFCDISKAFDKVWHKGLLNKLQKAGVSGSLLAWFEDYLKARKQKVVINGQESSTKTIEAGVPQGSVLGPLLFLLYINDIVENININVRLYADDTCIYVSYEDDPWSAAEEIENNLKEITDWANTWFVTFNPKKTIDLTFTRKRFSLSPMITMSNEPINNETKSHKHLGLTFQKDGKWREHTSEMVARAKRRNDIIRSSMYKLDRKSLETLYTSYVRPTLEYASEVWDGCTNEEKQLIEGVQLEGARIALGAKRGTSHAQLYEAIQWEPLQIRRNKQKLNMIYKVVNGPISPNLRELLPESTNERTTYNLRSHQNISTPLASTDALNSSFFPSTIKQWNLLPQSIRDSESIETFKRRLKAFMKSTSAVKQRFYTGNRKLQIAHTRIRLMNSNLNADLYQRNIKPSASCECGNENEDANHYFFVCPLHAIPRLSMINQLQQQSNVVNVCMEVILNGDNSMDEDSNVQIFKTVQHYIKETRRFE